jgi:hypothetical protein
MPSRREPDLQRQVDETFEAFRRSLQAMLAAEARMHVREAVARMEGRPGGFRIEDIDVEVVIRDLKLTAGTAPPRDAGAARRRRGGGTSAVRQALLAAFTETEELDTPRLRAILDQRGIDASVDNVHQQLRRLVQSGELERVGRGAYRRAPRRDAA